LFKNGDKSLPSNYRPISLLSCVSKVLEKIIFKHVFNHLLGNKLLYKFQSGPPVWPFFQVIQICINHIS
jgi:hypothetical protein